MCATCEPRIKNIQELIMSCKENIDQNVEKIVPHMFSTFSIQSHWRVRRRAHTFQINKRTKSFSKFDYVVQKYVKLIDLEKLYKNFKFDFNAI